jgi:hypothetical protein
MNNERDQWLKSVRLSYALLRIALGLNICLHGFVRWTVGLRSFAESLLPVFQKTPLPGWSVYTFGYMLPIVETLVGASVLSGLQTRRALISRVGSHACLDVRFDPAARLAHCRNTTHVFLGLFHFAGGDSI